MAASSLNILCFYLVAMISFFVPSHYSHEFTPPPPTALHLPIRKDETTLQYYTEIDIGNPRRYVNATLDFEADSLWFDCNGYNSSSYRPTPCGSTTCSFARSSYCTNCNPSLDEGCSANNTCGILASNPFLAKSTLLELGDDAMVVSATDGFSVLLDYATPHFLFSCANSFIKEGEGEGEGKGKGVGGLASGVIGIVGLAKINTSLQAQLSSAFKLPNKLALCLPSSSKDGFGDIFIGGGPYFMPPYANDLSKSLMTTPLVVNPRNRSGIRSETYPSDEYNIGVKSIRVDGKVLSFDSSVLSFDKDGYGGTTFSTTLPYSRVHSAIYNPLIKQFVKAAASRKMKRIKPLAPFGACFKEKSVAHTKRTGPAVPEIDLVLQGKRAVWRIFGANSMVKVKKNVLCLGFVDGGPEPAASFILAGKQLENYLLEFDLTSSKFGFSSSLLLLNTSCSHSRIF